MELKYKIEILEFISQEPTTKRKICEKFIVEKNPKPYNYLDIYKYLDECKNEGIIGFDLDAGGKFNTSEIRDDDKIRLTLKGIGHLNKLKKENNFVNLHWKFWTPIIISALVGLYAKSNSSKSEHKQQEQEIQIKELNHKVDSLLRTHQ